MKRLAGHREAIIFAVAIAAVLVFARFQVSESFDIWNLDRLRQETSQDLGPAHPFFAIGLDGDGQAYALIALDPFGANEEYGLYWPDYRYSRAGFAWLSSLVVLGKDELVLAGLALTGIASVAALAYLAAGKREELGTRAWLLVVNPALFLAVLGDTGESLSILLMALALTGGSLVSGLGLAIVRPSYLVAFADRRRLLIAGVLIAVAFRAIWVLHFGESFLNGTATISFPFSGLVAEPTIVGAIVAAAGALTAVIGIRDRSWSWALSGLLVVCLSGVVYDNPLNAVRAAGMLPVLWAVGRRRSSDVKTVRELSYSEHRVRKA